MKIIVTGGAGFIASHLVDALLARGDDVVVIDDFSTGARSNLPKHSQLQIVEARLGSDQHLDLAGRYDGIVHLAGLPSVSASFEREMDAHDRTLTATVALIALCERLEIPRFVFASSAAVYGRPAHLPITEDARCQPLSPYGLQKLAGEKYLELFALHHGFTAINLRFFNVYGPRQQPGSAYSGVISIFAEALRKGERLQIFGDGSQTRDFIFVADVVDAVCAAIEAPLPNGHSRVLNIGTGGSTSLLALVEALQSGFATRPPEITFAPARAGDILHSQPDISAARKFLGFAPKWGIQDGLRRLAESLTRC